MSVVKGTQVQSALENSPVVPCSRGTLRVEGYCWNKAGKSDHGGLLRTETLFSKLWGTTEVLGEGNNPTSPWKTAGWEETRDTSF